MTSEENASGFDRRTLLQLVTASTATISAGCLESISWEVLKSKTADTILVHEISETEGTVRIDADYGSNQLGKTAVLILDMTNERIIYPSFDSSNPVKDEFTVLSPFGGITANPNSDPFPSPDPIEFSTSNNIRYLVIVSRYVRGVELDKVVGPAFEIELRRERLDLGSDNNVKKVEGDPLSIPDLQTLSEDILLTDSNIGKYKGFAESDESSRKSYFATYLALREAHQRLHGNDGDMVEIWNILVKMDVRKHILDNLNSDINEILNILMLILQTKYNLPDEVVDDIERNMRDRVHSVMEIKVPIGEIKFNADDMSRAVAPVRLRISAEADDSIYGDVDDFSLFIDTPQIEIPMTYSSTWKPTDSIESILENKLRARISEIDTEFEYIPLE